MRLRFVFLLFAMWPTAAWAQPSAPSRHAVEVFALAGPGQMWDDEGYLGVAMTAGAGFGYRLGRLGIEGLVDRRDHQPDFGNDVVIRSEATRVTGRLLYHFGRAQVQPYAGGSVGFWNVDRFSSFPDDCRFVDHTLVCSGTREFQSIDRSVALSGIAGVRFRSGRWFVRPEFELGKAGNDLTISGTVAVGYGW
jgi:hypothetical protein